MQQLSSLEGEKIDKKKRFRKTCVLMNKISDTDISGNRTSKMLINIRAIRRKRKEKEIL